MDGQCDGLGLPETPDCSAQGVPSVVVTVTDQDGVTLPFATVAFTFNGGRPFFVFCDGDCEGFAIALNAFGTFDITAGARA